MKDKKEKPVLIWECGYRGCGVTGDQEQVRQHYLLAHAGANYLKMPKAIGFKG